METGGELGASPPVAQLPTEGGSVPPEEQLWGRATGSPPGKGSTAGGDLCRRSNPNSIW
jgi:hypothetical protein